jgi:hypothetical protein
MAWNSIAVVPRTSKPFYGQVVLHGYSVNRFGGLPSGISSSTRSRGRCSPALVVGETGGRWERRPGQAHHKAALASGGVRPPLLGVI